MKEWFMFVFRHKIKIVHDAPRAEGCSESWQKLDELTLGTVSPWGNTYYAYLHSKKYSLLYSVVGRRFILTPWQYKRIRAYKIKKTNKTLKRKMGKEWNMNDYKHFWKTKDGKIIPYKLMTTEHLNNTYDMLTELDYEFRCAGGFSELPAYVYDAMRAIEKELESREQKDKQ